MEELKLFSKTYKDVTTGTYNLTYNFDNGTYMDNEAKKKNTGKAIITVVFAELRFTTINLIINIKIYIRRLLIPSLSTFRHEIPVSTRKVLPLGHAHTVHLMSF